MLRYKIAIKGKRILTYFKTEEIESISLEKIQQMIRKTGQRKLTPSFDTNDKGPSWDGFITAYNKDGSSSKNDISSRIAVQIKGTEVKKLSNKFKSFKIELSDLRNYLNDGGIIYFVVEVKGSQEEICKIFYTSLLPVDIQCILDDTKENQKTVNVKLNNILSSDTNFYLECKNFEINKQNQAVSQVKVSKTLDELNYTNNERIEFLRIGNPLDIINKKVYPYIRDEHDCLIPVREVITVNKVVFQHNKELIVNGKKYFDTYKEHRSEDEVYISFGDIIIVKDNMITIKRSEGYIEDRKKTLDFLFDNIREKSNLSIDELKIMEELRLEKEFIKKIKTVSKRFNIDISKLKLTDLTSDDEYFLDRLESVKYGSIKSDNIVDIQPTIIKFLNKEVQLLKCFYSEGNAYYDFFSSDLNMGIKSEVEEKEVKLSIYAIMGYESILCENFNKDIVIESLERTNKFYTEAVGNQYTLLVLELIKAWDICNNETYMELAKYILDSIREDSDRDILEINKAQIEYRISGSLNYKTIGILLNIVSNTDNDNYKAAIYILLDDYKEFEQTYNKLGEEEKKTFESYPIYYIYKKNIKVI